MKQVVESNMMRLTLTPETVQTVITALNKEYNEMIRHGEPEEQAVALRSAILEITVGVRKVGDTMKN